MLKRGGAKLLVRGFSQQKDKFCSLHTLSIDGFLPTRKCADNNFFCICRLLTNIPGINVLFLGPTIRLIDQFELASMVSVQLTGVRVRYSIAWYIDYCVVSFGKADCFLNPKALKNHLGMKLNLLWSFLVICTLLPFLSSAQTSLNGKITDQDSKEVIGYAAVSLFRNGVQITGVYTDENGLYNFADIDPGVYEIETSFLGYQPARVTGIKVLAGKSNKADVVMISSGGIVLTEHIVTAYKVPLIEQDNTTSGAVITSDQIRNLPTRNINAIAATAAGLASADEGRSINVRGSRSNNTDYYQDGIRIQGNLIPETEIEQLQVITGGIEAQYGDVTGGIISITTKGPARKFTGGAEVETSRFLDAYNNSLAGINLSGPILKKKSNGQSLLGYRVSGRYTYRLDDDPTAVPVYKAKSDKLKELEENPIIQRQGSFLVNADFLGFDDADALKARPNESSQRIDLTAKLEAKPTKNLDFSLTGAFSDNQNEFTPGGWRLLNSNNNPTAFGNTYRGIFRVRHRLGGFNAENGPQTKNALIQNASYTLIFSYEKTDGKDYDARHKLNYFDYGYVGKFDIEWIPTFGFEFDPTTQQSVLKHTDYRQVLRRYTPGEQNPVLANYNKVLGINSNETLNSGIGRIFIPGIQDPGTVLAADNFIAPNGFISNIYTNSWGFHSNVGSVYNNAGFNDNDLYTFNGRLNFDLVPDKSGKSRHNIQLGLIYEQRTDRGYAVAPRNLWNIARQQANNHILGITPQSTKVGTITDTIGGQAVTLDLLSLATSQNEDNKFYRAVRQKNNIPLSTYVNVDGMDPDELSLDMFSAKELNDQGVLSYFGYDYLGNKFNGTFDDFFTATDADGVRTFPIAPNRPIYSAFYLQDKFTFKDIIFRLGVRVDRYDANTKVLKDPYSLYDIMGASEYHEKFGGERPGNIGDDYKVYLNDAGTRVQAYRQGDQWYRANGAPVNSPVEIFSGGLVFPQYQDENARRVPNYIKSREFNTEASFRDYEAQVNIMPRLAFSFPISEDANFFAHYDILVQRPASNTLATAADYFYFTDNAGAIKNNPDLKPERTIDYEVGFQQRLTASSKLKTSAYYKEIRNWVQLRTYFPVPIISQYTTYDNIDFGTVKGFLFEYELRRTANATLNANYTLQFADGTGSDANSQRGLTSRGNLRTLFPLNYDERHRINLNFDYRIEPTTWKGPAFMKEMGLNLQGIMVSGRPYTARQTPLELGGTQTIGSINGARKPWNFTLNLRVDKTVQLSKGSDVNIYCRISNVLDRRNVINVYPATGSSTDDGFLASSQGQDKLRNIENSARLVDSYLASYQWVLLNPGFFSLPRRIFVGATYQF
jgi:outer membrane receptor protein involved in Fe transport